MCQYPSRQNPHATHSPTLESPLLILSWGVLTNPLLKVIKLSCVRHHTISSRSSVNESLNEPWLVTVDRDHFQLKFVWFLPPQTKARVTIGPFNNRKHEFPAILCFMINTFFIISKFKCLQLLSAAEGGKGGIGIVVDSGQDFSVNFSELWHGHEDFCQRCQLFLRVNVQEVTTFILTVANKDRLLIILLHFILEGTRCVR